MPPEQEASQLHVRPFLVVSANCAGAANATLMRSRQSRAPINQYHHDQHNNDHHNSRQSEPPNSEAISPTARRSVAPTTWRNVARVVHLNSIHRTEPTGNVLRPERFRQPYCISS